MRWRSRAKPDLVALFGAALLHVVVVGSIALSMRATTESGVRSPRTALLGPSVEIELFEPAEMRGDSLVGSALMSFDKAAASRQSTEPGRARHDPFEAVPVPADPAAESEPSSVSTDSLPPSEEPPEKGAIDLGIGANAWERWVAVPDRSQGPPTGDAPPRTNRYHLFRAPPQSTTGGLQEGLEARDTELGLGPSGRAMTALQRAAHGSVAPAVGVARFRVTVLRTGAVDVALASASDDHDAWRAVAADAAEDLRRNPPRLPSARDGARLTIDLTAEETLPNGLKRRSLHGARLEPVPPRLRSAEEQRAELRERNPTAGTSTSVEHTNAEIPGLYVAGQGKVCGYRFGLSVLGPLLQGGCDFSNLGARPQRMVRTHVTEEAFF